MKFTIENLFSDLICKRRFKNTVVTRVREATFDTFCQDLNFHSTSCGCHSINITMILYYVLFTYYSIRSIAIRILYNIMVSLLFNAKKDVS